MNPDTNLYVTNKGSLLMRGGKLLSPGASLKAADFKGIEANLQTLLAAGNLSLSPVEAQELDIERGEQLPPIPLAKADGTIDLSLMPKIVAGKDEQATLAKVREIKAAAEARVAEEAKRQKVLADFAGASLTPAEAKELGVIA